MTEEEKRIQQARAQLPPPEAALNLYDIEVSTGHIGFTQLFTHLSHKMCRNLPRRCSAQPPGGTTGQQAMMNTVRCLSLPMLNADR